MPDDARDDLSALDGRSDLPSVGSDQRDDAGDPRSRQARVSARAAHHKARYAKAAGAGGGALLIILLIALRVGGRAWSRHEREQREEAVAQRVIERLNAAVENATLGDDHDEAFELGFLTQEVVDLHADDILGLKFSVQVSNLDAAEALRPAITLRILADDGALIGTATATGAALDPAAAGRVALGTVRVPITKAEKLQTYELTAQRQE